MRRALVAGIVLSASIFLASCGSNSTATTLKEFVASFGSQPYVQVHLTVSTTGHGVEKAAPIEKQFSLDIHAENPSGGSLAQANGNASVELLLHLGDTTLADVRIVGKTLYFKIDLSGLSTIPGIHIPQGQLQAVNLVFGGRWFEIPQDVLAQLAPKPSRQQVAQSSAIEAQVVDALAKFIDSSHYTKSSSGFTESGSIQKLEEALGPTFAGIAHKAYKPTSVAGTYTVKLSTSGSTVTGVSVSVTAPFGTSGNATGTVTAKVSHDAVTVSAPTGATTITPQLIRELEASGSGG